MGLFPLGLWGVFLVPQVGFFVAVVGAWIPPRCPFIRIRMAKKSKPSRPLTIDLPTSLIEKIELCRRGSGFASNSEVVRAAISEFDFATCRPEQEQHRQISVRIAPEQRAALQRYSRQKDVSVGELLRMAIDALTTRKSRRR